MQTIVYQCDTAMPAQKLPNCCNYVALHYKCDDVCGVLKNIDGSEGLRL